MPDHSDLDDTSELNPDEESDSPAQPNDLLTDAKEARTWAMACRLSALASFVGIPFGNILWPLIY